MGVTTGIEWTDATWNPIRARNRKTGKVGWFCEKISPGCKNCYASRWNHARGNGAVYVAEKLAEVELFLDEKMLLQPLRWNRARNIFLGSMTDVFWREIPDEWIDRIFAVMALCPQHTFQVLTKRPERMLKYFDGMSEDPAERLEIVACEMELDEDTGCDIANWVNGWNRWQHAPDDSNPLDGTVKRWPLPNVQLGVSVEDQKTADERIPLLLQTPAAVRFISAEPLLGDINLKRWMYPMHWHWDSKFKTPEAAKAAGAYAELKPQGLVSASARFLDWVIVGGESGPGARPMHPDWARSLRDQCVAAGVPFFFKQWGEWTEVGGGAPHHLHDADVSAPPIDSVNCILGVDAHRPGTAAEMRDRAKYRWLSRVGKKAAGSLLDGVEWKQFPEVPR